MIQVTDLITKLQEVRLNGGFNVLSTGSYQLDQRLRLVKSFPWFIGGQPYHGKTEVTKELLLKWSIMYGWKHYCYFGEDGGVEHVIADLCYKLIGKPYSINIDGHMNESERTWAEQFIAKHFYFADPNEDFTYDKHLKNIMDAENMLGFRFDTTTIDPFNDMEYDLENNITYWLKKILKDCRKQGLLYNRIPIFVVHVGDIKPIVKDSLTYIPPAMPTEWEGGRIWNRRAFVQIGVWKDLEGKTRLMVHKAKPKQAKIYNTEGDCIWQWNWKKNRYMENRNGYTRDVIENDFNPESYSPTRDIKPLNSIKEKKDPF